MVAFVVIAVVVVVTWNFSLLLGSLMRPSGALHMECGSLKKRAKKEWPNDWKMCQKLESKTGKNRTHV